jgi:hypothetical protein
MSVNCGECGQPVTGVSLIAAERMRQIAVEGFTIEHDAQHDPKALPWAAWCYADLASAGTTYTDPSKPPTMWPRAPELWKPDKSPIRMFTIGGALFAAEIDRRIHLGERP